VKGGSEEQAKKTVARSKARASNSKGK